MPSAIGNVIRMCPHNWGAQALSDVTQKAAMVTSQYCLRSSTKRYRLVGVYKLGRPVKQFVRITVVDECCEQYQGVPPPTHSVT